VIDTLAACRRCTRLADFLARIRLEYPGYHARPVAPFGDPKARLLIIGLAPGMHGANASGRPFTGDHAGILLYATLYRYGFSNQPISSARDDGLTLTDCRITNAVKCLPPQNKPLGAEIDSCNHYLQQELREMPTSGVLLALGAIAHRAVLKALQCRQSSFPFGHGAEHPLSEGLTLLDSYHCSRYNTQTGRLTPEMFQAVFARARELL
jgi:uracil-DNA glycosylase family 4